MRWIVPSNLESLFGKGLGYSQGAGSVSLTAGRRRRMALHENPRRSFGVFTQPLSRVPLGPNVNARLRLAIVSALLGLLVLRQDRQQRLGGDNALVSGFSRR